MSHIPNKITYKILSDVSEPISIRITTYMTNLFRGIGIAYCIEKEKYMHLPITLMFPSIYLGYQIFTNKEYIKKFIKE